MRFSGIYTALATPFQNGEVDYSSLSRLVQFQQKQGVDGFVISGTTAESPVLSMDEKKKIFEAVKSESEGRMPLIIGTGSNSTAATIEATQLAESWGADAALVVVPYYNKPPQQGLVEHFKAVAKATQLPIVLYNVPARTVTGLTLESIVELSRIENIVAIKEATGDASFSEEIVKACGNDFLVSSGDDGAYLDVFKCGGRGVISVLSHLIGDRMKDWAKRIQDGDQQADAEFTEHRQLIDLLFCQSNPIPVKAALHQLGVFASDEVRLPLIKMHGPERQELFDLVDKMGIKA